MSIKRVHDTYPYCLVDVYILHAQTSCQISEQKNFKSYCIRYYMRCSVEFKSARKERHFKNRRGLKTAPKSAKLILNLTFKMAFPREKISSTSLHLWVSDTNGGIHVLCHVNTEATSSSSQDMKWREVEENSDYHQLVGGASDVILGVDCSDKELFVRDKVSYSEPLGKKWLPTGCHVTHTAVGKQYIGVIIHEERRALIGTISLVRGSHFCPIKWEEISGDIPRDLAYITMTTDDVLYGITVGGVVYGCYGIRELTRPLIWEFLSKPPVPARKGFLSSLFGTTPTTIFDHVTSNGKGVWCYSQRNSEIWLLNIYEKPNKTHNTNWTRFNLPSSTPKLISITCNPMGGTNETTLYGISEDGHGLYELIPIGNKIDIFELPFHGYGDITMTTVTCSLLMKKEEKEVKTIPSLYPKLPKLSPEKGLCCENGTCSFCLGRSSLTSVSTETTSTWGTTAMTGVTSTSLISPGYTKDLYTVDNYRQQIKDFRRGQRSHSPSLEGAKKAKEGNDFEYLSSPRQATPTTARKRRSHSITQRLVRDIPVVVTTSTSAERVRNKDQ